MDCEPLHDTMLKRHQVQDFKNHLHELQLKVKLFLKIASYLKQICIYSQTYLGNICI